VDRLNALLSWVRGILFRRAADAEMDEELRFHIEMETEHNLRAGMSPMEARRRALAAFGGIERHRERLREGRRVPVLEAVGQDLRFGFRSLIRDPWLSLMSIAVVSLGVGATTAVLSVVYAVMLRPLPVPDVDGLASIQEDRMGSTSTSNGWSLIPYPRFEAYRDATGEVFQSLSAYRRTTFSVRLPDVTITVEGANTSGDFFTTLGVRPQLGRAFTSDGVDEAVISHELWVSRFGADPAVIGSVLQVERRPVAIVGVLPPGFRGFTLLPDELWIPFSIPATDRAGVPLRATPVGRLRAGVTHERAAAAVEVAAHAIAPEPGTTVRRARLDPVTLIPASARAPVGTFLGILLAMGVLVLLIASGNVSGVLMARAVARQREMAVRLAIGAGRARLIRHMLAETLLLFASAAVAGIGLAHLGTSWLMNLPIPRSIPIEIDVAPDRAVLAVALLVTLGSAFAFGLFPALRGSRPGALHALRSGGAGSVGSGGKTQAIIVAGQVMLSVLLLLTATLFSRSLQKGLAIDPGFDPEGVVIAELDAARGYDPDGENAFYDALTERLRALPGVRGVTLSQFVFLSGTNAGTDVRRPEAPDVALNASWNTVDTAFFSTLGIDLLAGRDFDDRDVPGSAPVVVVNQALADRLWPGSSPLGQVLRGLGGRDREVVGVVRTGRYGVITEAPRPYVFMPIAQWGPSRLAVQARAPAAEGPTLRAIQAEVRKLDPDVAVEPGLLSEFVGTGLFGTAWHRSWSGSSGSWVSSWPRAASTACSRSTSRSARVSSECGGPSGRAANHVIRLVLGRMGWLVGAGLAAGLLLGGGVGSLMRSFLVELSPLDPVTFLSVPAVLAWSRWPRAGGRSRARSPSSRPKRCAGLEEPPHPLGQALDLRSRSRPEHGLLEVHRQDATTPAESTRDRERSARPRLGLQHDLERRRAGEDRARRHVLDDDRGVGRVGDAARGSEARMDRAKELEEGLVEPCCAAMRRRPVRSTSWRFPLGAPRNTGPLDRAFRQRLRVDARGARRSRRSSQSRSAGGAHALPGAACFGWTLPGSSPR
jgi:predicted permease